MSDEEIKYMLVNLQKENVKLFEEFGLIDEVLDLQTVINKLRSRFNIYDEIKLIDY